MGKYSFCFWICFLYLSVVWSCSDDLPQEPMYPLVLKSDSLQLNPSEGNLRRSEGDFILLRGDTILVMYSRFIDGWNDHGHAVLSGRVSIDNGISWGSEEDIITNKGWMNVMSVSLLRLQNDSVAIFYLVKNTEFDCFPVMRTSGNECKTWSPVRSCVETGMGKGYFVLNNCRVIQLESGRILVPVSCHSLNNSQVQEDGLLFCFYSDDGGITWSKSGIVPKKSGMITQEPGVVELKDGRVLLYMRTASGYQYFSYSSDKGESWSSIQPSTLKSPKSPALIVRNPFTKHLVAVWNNSFVSRTPLCIAQSIDEGQNWIQRATVEYDPNLWFCYPAIEFPDPETILLSYSVGPEEKWGFGGLKLIRIRLSRLY